MVARVFTGGWGASRGSENLGGSRGVVWTPPLSGKPWPHPLSQVEG